MTANDLNPSVGEAVVPTQLTGGTPGVEAVRQSVEAVASHPRAVVLSGETGTGKEVVARLIHRRSGRQGPFVAVNCGGFTESLLASELFGHVRGAFTGAIADQPGLFRAAHGGTLFLDEAGDIPPALQATLLRVLETRQVRPVGGTRDVLVDVRVISASNRELVTLVRQGEFRADLYARLAQWVIRLPPLRERRDDIPALSRALLSQLGAAGRTLSPGLEEALLLHPWPLNVRGLANVLGVAAIATPPGLPLDLGPEVQAALDDNRIEGSLALPEVVSAELDRAGLENLLRRFGGRVSVMARHLGMSRSRMYRLLGAEDLDPATFRVPSAARSHDRASTESDTEEADGGVVEDRSEGVGHGVEFASALPLAPRPVATSVSKASMRRLKVIVIEDEQNLRDDLAETLRLEGCEVITAQDGRSGVDLVKEVRPDVVISDLGLPDLSGYEVARELRSEASLASCRLFALTGFDRPEDVQRAKEAGFDAHLPKPLRMNDLRVLLAYSALR